MRARLGDVEGRVHWHSSFMRTAQFRRSRATITAEVVDRMLLHLYHQRGYLRLLLLLLLRRTVQQNDYNHKQGCNNAAKSEVLQKVHARNVRHLWGPGRR